MSLQSNLKNLSPLRSRQLSFPGNHVNVLHIQWPGPTHQNLPPPPLTVRFSEFCLHHHHQCLDSTLYTASPPPQIWRHHDAVSPPKTFTFSYCAHGNKIFSVRSKWRPSRSKCRDVSVCGAVSSSVRLSSLSLTVCSQRTQKQCLLTNTSGIKPSISFCRSQARIGFVLRSIVTFFFTNQGCSSVTSKRLWLKRGLRKRYLKTCTNKKPKISLAQFEVVHENVGFWCNWSEAVHTSTPDIWLYPEMKTCSNILRLTQTLKGPHVHTYYQRSMKGNIYIKLGAGNSGWSWIETLDSQRADGFSLDVTDTVWCRTYAQSDGNKGQKNPAVYRQTGITWRGFLTKRLNVL